MTYKTYKKEFMEYGKAYTGYRDGKSPEFFHYFLGELGMSIRTKERMGGDDSRKMEVINDLRENFPDDLKKCNLLMKYMGMKERLTKKGFRGSAQAKSADAISESLKEQNVGGVKYKISPTYIKNSFFKSEDEFKKSFTNVANSLPEAAKKNIAAGNTTVHFVTRPEAGKLTRAASSNNVLGYYLPNTQQVFIFPDKGNTITRFNLGEGELSDAGYDDDTIKGLMSAQGNDNWEHTVTHELCHAVALNPVADESSDKKKQYQDKYNDMLMSLKENPNYNSFDGNHITRYSMTNFKEDLAEHMAFYARHKEFADKAIDQGDSTISFGLRQKFKFLRDTLWG